MFIVFNAEWACPKTVRSFFNVTCLILFISWNFFPLPILSILWNSKLKNKNVNASPTEMNKCWRFFSQFYRTYLNCLSPTFLFIHWFLHFLQVNLATYSFHFRKDMNQTLSVIKKKCKATSVIKKTIPCNNQSVNLQKNIERVNRYYELVTKNIVSWCISLMVNSPENGIRVQTLLSQFVFTLQEFLWKRYEPISCTYELSGQADWALCNPICGECYRKPLLSFYQNNHQYITVILWT